MPSVTTNTSTANAALAIPWRDLWNGDLTITDGIIAEVFPPAPRSSPDRNRR